ncbi:MAG: crotonase/enoyl-CoA hydratase family protein [Desulfatibacillum sp.]|nr:crotonase/enoyl-CoA hydratase family protein [Desulfatibacillum sp.]
MSYQDILYQVEDSILTITLNRPDRLNAFTITMKNEILDALDRADQDDAIRAIIFTGAGRAFCAGMELGAKDNIFGYEIPQTEPYNIEEIRDSGGEVSLRLYDCKKPVIAAINGPAVGVGITMTLAMDFRMASEKAKIGFVFSQRGLCVEACSSWFLPRIVGVSQALEWVYSGEVFKAQEALDGGLLRSIHAPEDLLPEARKLAKKIADNTAPISVALSRQLMWKMLGANHPMDAHNMDSRAIYYASETDGKEGIMSFLEKREPEFKVKVSSDMPYFYPWWKSRKPE